VTFGGPFFPGFLARPEFINLIPEIKGLRFQVVHSYEVGEAYRLALLHDLHGAFNLAADRVLDVHEVGRVLYTRPVPVPVQLARAGARLSWQLRLQPMVDGWLDLALSSPILDTSRARQELSWMPQRSAEDTVLDLLAGLREGAGLDTPTLSPKIGDPNLTLTRTQYGATRSKAGKGNPSKYAGFATPCKPLQRVTDHS
jgi:nucleoside-diphosphate-sugar epimerase